MYVRVDTLQTYNLYIVSIYAGNSPDAWGAPSSSTFVNTVVDVLCSLSVDSMDDEDILDSFVRRFRF